MALTPKAFCLYAQTELANVVDTDPLMKNLKPTGLLDALSSPQNAQGIDLLKVDTSGKKIRLDLKYYGADCGGTATGKPDLCSGDAIADDSEYITLEQSDANYISKQHTLSTEEFRVLCDSKDGRISRKMATLAFNVLNREREYYTAEIYTKVNDYYNGNTSLPGSGTEQTLNLFSDTGVRQGMGLFKLIKEYQMKGYVEAPIIVGGTTISAWSYANAIFGANTDGAGTGGGITPFIDTFTSMYGAGGAGDANERLLSWTPGHNQAIRWHKNLGDFARSKESFTKTTMLIGGQLFDVSVFEDDCNDKVVLTVGRGNTLFNLNIDGGTCHAQPSTLNWIADCGELDCTVVKQPVQGS